MPLHELPSLAFPLYHIAGLVAVAAALVGLLFGIGWIWLVAAIVVLLLPAVLLGVKTSVQAGRPWSALALAVLYFTYGLARAVALFK
jgi:hypothetical protein